MNWPRRLLRAAVLEDPRRLGRLRLLQPRRLAWGRLGEALPQRGAPVQGVGRPDVHADALGCSCVPLLPKCFFCGVVF